MPLPPSSSSIPPDSESYIPLPRYITLLLSTPFSYEIPLRTMYTNNVLAQSNKPSPSTFSSTGMTPQLNQAGWQPSKAHGAVEHLQASMKTQMSSIQSQPQSLPPSFITSFVRRCFTEDLCLVDFTQALTAMDYLKILDDRRKRELSAALRRLNVDATSLEQDRHVLNSTYPGILDWVSSMEDKSRKIEALYTQVYIGLRRWTLINEMRLTPFNKPNCIAMLNTLYPPTYGPLPTTQLTDAILNAQRNAFFRYIQAVEKNGKAVLQNLENASRRASDQNGWPVVRDIVDVYLRKANSIIDECLAIKSLEDFETTCNGKRADSGVSFASVEKRPGTSRGSSSSTLEKPLPSQPSVQAPPLKKSGSTFERIARELRRIKSRSADSKDDMSAKTPMLPEKRALRKMKSTGALNREASYKKDGKHSRGNSSDRGALYEIDEAQRERLIREAQKDKENRRPKRMPSPTHFGVHRSNAADPYPFPHEEHPALQNLLPRDPYALPEDEFVIAELSA